MMRVHWPALAISTMLVGAVLLFRSTPVHPAWCLLLFGVWPWLRTWRPTLLLTVLLSLWMAWTYQQQWQSRWLQSPHNLSLQGQVEGVVSQRQSARHFAFVVDAPGQQLDGQMLRVAWYREAEDVQSGDCWQLDLRVRPPHGFANPGGMDYEAWLFREGYAGKASVRDGRLCGRGEVGLRQHIKQALLQDRSAVAAATVSALLLGDRSGLDAQQWDILRRTGTSHLFAISGLHVGLMAAVGWGLGLLLWRLWLYRYLPRQRDVAAMLAASFALLYAALSGFAVPAQRALLMCLLALLAMQLGRQQRGLSILALVWCVVVALNPLCLLMPGLWLSFVAVAGIVLYLQAFPKQPRWLQLLGIQLLLGLLLLPLSVLFFGGFSLLAAPVNLLLVPLFSLLLPSLMLAAVCQLLGWTWPLQWALKGLDALWAGLGVVAGQPAAYVSLIQPAWWVAAAATLAVLLAVQRSLPLRIVASLLLLPWLFSASTLPALGELRLWFWDVGQGQSVLLQTARHNLLYDAGPAWSGGFDAGERIVLPALQQVGVQALAGMVISHADSDHAGGAAAIEQALPVAQRWGAGGQDCRRGQHWQWDGLRFEFLHPDQASRWSDNSGSCVLTVSNAAGQSVLLTGDIEDDAEIALLALPQLQPQTVISVPHHGSASSSSSDFVQRVSAQWAVVSAGFQNRWGHPALSALDAYERHGTQVLNTAWSGAIRMDLGAALSVRAWRQEKPRIWRTFPHPDTPERLASPIMRE